MYVYVCIRVCELYQLCSAQVIGYTCDANASI